MKDTRYQVFEEFLKEKHAEDYHGTDDDMPDAFEAWLTNLDTDELMRLADDAILEAYRRGMHHGSDIALDEIKRI